MDRRSFITKAGAVGTGAVAAAVPLATPAIAQAAPEIKWRLTSGFPKSLDTIFGAADVFSKAVADMTDGKFNIQVFPAGELVPTPQALEAVQNATVEMAHTASYYYIGKDPTFVFGTGLPFGLNARQQNAWLYDGGGNEALNAFYAGYNVIGFAGGNTGTQMGGWFRKEINSVADLQGLKFRVGGLAGKILAKMGAVPQQLPAADVYPALEKGTIDAAEFVGPYDDEKLGFYQVAKNYYYPAFWEGGSTLHFFVNKDAFASLPKTYQAIVETAAYKANSVMLARYDARNVDALKRLVGAGVQLKPFSKEFLEAAYATTFEFYNELNGSNEAWKTLYGPWMEFRAKSYQWFRVTEYTFDSFVYAMQAAGK